MNCPPRHSFRQSQGSGQFGSSQKAPQYRGPQPVSPQGVVLPPYGPRQARHSPAAATCNASPNKPVKMTHNTVSRWVVVFMLRISVDFR